MHNAKFKVAGTVAALVVTTALLSSSAAQKDKFLNRSAVQNAIKTFQKKVNKKTLLRVYLLEVVKAEEDKELMYVYFIPDKSPKTYRNAGGIVNNSRAPIFLATFHYSYLGETWRVKNIKEYKGDMVFFAL